MADQTIPLTDDELKALAPELAQDPTLAAKLTSDERRRLGQFAAPTVPSAALSLAGAAEAVPAAARMAGKVATSMPRLVQRTIGGAMRVPMAAAGNTIGGIPGAIAGNSIAGGLTPTQSSIREVGGLLAGESPTVATQAARSQAIVEYARSLGIKLNPQDLAALPEGSRALTNYAEAGGKRIIQLIDPTTPVDVARAGGGRVVTGPMAMEPIGGSVGPLSKISQGVSAMSRVLHVASGAQGVLDLAQAAEPDRKDIGMFGVGPSVSADEIDQRRAAQLQDKLKRGLPVYAPDRRWLEAYLARTKEP